MKFTLNWLKSFLDTEASLEKIVETLTIIGLEVEEVIDRREELAVFEVAEIIDAAPHPEADKLRVCQVKTANEVLGIVCGAPNARKGIKVVLAKIGTTIPNGNFKIKQAKIRGIDSSGMLCSAEELNIKGDSTGIIELPDSAIVGEPIAGFFGLDDPVIHINVTPNRADSLGVYGIARDLAAAGIGVLKQLPEIEITGNFESNVNIRVKDLEACPLFAIRQIKNITNNQSPLWLKNYLSNIGISSISAIVDITNYIAFTFGQPMHAYDYNKLVGNELIVERLTSADKFSALNGKEYELDENDLIIRDSQNIQCLAGIIGSASSACSENTDNIVLEAASFNSKLIAQTGRKHGIESDSRYRFERYVDRDFTVTVHDYATKMVLDICGGEASEIKLVSAGGRGQRKINFAITFFEKRMGFAIDALQATTILEKLGFTCIPDAGNIEIIVPSWRSDVSLPEDIVEEIARIHGYDNILTHPLPPAQAVRVINPEQRRLADLKRLTASIGYNEIVTWSFMDSQKAALFCTLSEDLLLQNPISSDLDYMRPSIIPNLLKAACNNINRSIKDTSLFELGPIFSGSAAQVPIRSLAAIRTGHDFPRNCHFALRNVDVFDIKSDLEIIFTSIGLELDKCRLSSDMMPSYYHPTRSAVISLGKNILGYFGQIHPAVLEEFGIECEVMAFELNLSQLPPVKERKSERAAYIVSDYQPVMRDYAFLVEDGQTVGEILQFIRNIDKNLIRQVSLFDLYSGDKITAGKKSIAISVIMQDNSKTLTDSEIDHVSNLIINGVKEKFNATLRQ